MANVIEAVYEGGLFRPIGEVNLKEGTHVEVRVPQAAAIRDPHVVATKLAELAANAPVTGQINSVARNHDQILYGGKNQE